MAFQKMWSVYHTGQDHEAFTASSQRGKSPILLAYLGTTLLTIV